MTPMVSERDSSVVLPQAHTGQVRPQWTLEVDPGQYLVVATVGDRNVGFAAHLEVGGQPLFSGDWVDAGSFKSRCLLCVTSRGAITVSPHWPRGAGGRDRDDAALHDSIRCESGVRHDSPLSPRGGGSPPRPHTRNEALARGTRLVSLRVVAVPLAREVEREQRPALWELSQKLADARMRVDSARQAVQLAQVELPAVDHRGAGALERELRCAQSKLAEIHMQRTLKLFSMIAVCKRVAHPYIYLNGEASSAPPVGQPDLERPAL